MPGLVISCTRPLRRSRDTPVVQDVRMLGDQSVNPPPRALKRVVRRVAVLDGGHLSSGGDTWRALAGPAVLGRSILLGPGAETPAPWTSCDRIQLTERTIVDPATLCTVRRNFLTRTPVICEVNPTS